MLNFNKYLPTVNYLLISTGAAYLLIFSTCFAFSGTPITATSVSETPISETQISETQIAKTTAGLPAFPSGNLHFYQLLKPVMEHHERIKSAKEAVEEARERILIKFGIRYPELELTIEAGREDEYGKEDPEHYNSIKLKLSQLLWDFGKTDAVIEKVRRELIDKELTLKQVRQKFVFDAVQVYQKLHKAYIVLQFSRESQKNIRHQTGLEEILMAEGSGYSTDVLQSKSQLASAISRTLRNEGDYYIAESEYIEIFGMPPDNIKQMFPVDSNQCLSISQEIEPVLQAAMQRNIELSLARNRKDMAEIDLQGEKSSFFFPDINFTLEASITDNYNGVFGNSKDYKAMVELKKSINLGLTEKNSVRAAKHNLLKEKYQIAEKEKTVKKNTRTAWQKLKTAEATTQTLMQQAELTAAFLELARKERMLGNRSLLEVLNGETSLINAKSDSYASRIDTSLAAFSLLEITGVLSLELFNIK